MKAKLLLLALLALLVLPTVTFAGETSTHGAAQPATEAFLATLVPASSVAGASAGCAAAASTDLALSPIQSSLVCGGITYPGCAPGGSCKDPCGYCECRAEGTPPGLCSYEYCLGH